MSKIFNWVTYNYSEKFLTLQRLTEVNRHSIMVTCYRMSAARTDKVLGIAENRLREQ